MEPDLSVSARKVLTKRLLQVAPGRVTVHAGQSHPTEVILRSPLDGPVDVHITSENPEFAEVEPSVVTISAGRVTASFEVIGISSGETTVMVEVTDLGASVEVPVTVRGEQRDLELNWRPDHINIGTDQDRRVVLMLNQEAPGTLEVTLVEEGEPGDLIFPGTVEFQQGDRHILVGIGSGGIPGEFKIRATLPDGVSDVLEVKVRARSDREREKNRDEGDDDNRGRDGENGNNNNRGRDGVDGDDDNRGRDSVDRDDDNREGDGEDGDDDNSGKEGDDNSGPGEGESDGDEGDDNSGSEGG